MAQDTHQEIDSQAERMFREAMRAVQAGTMLVLTNQGQCGEPRSIVQVTGQ